jgi:hypothetical protein
MMISSATMTQVSMSVFYPDRGRANPSTVAAIGFRTWLPRERAQAPASGSPALSRAPCHATATHARLGDRIRRSSSVNDASRYVGSECGFRPATP